MVSFPEIRGSRRIAVDIETRDDDLKTKGPGVRSGGYIAGVAIATEANGAMISNYYPMRHQRGDNCDPAQVMGYVSDILAGSNKEVVGTNLLYDLDYLANEGLACGRPLNITGKYLDVQVAEPLIDESKRGEYDLDSLSQHYLGVGKDSDALYKWLADTFGGRATRSAQIGRVWRAPGDIVQPYAISDVENPLRIIAKQLDAIEKAGLTEIWELERDLEPMLLAMRRRGVRINVAKADEANARMAEQIAGLEKYVADKGVSIHTASTIADYCRSMDIEFPLTEKLQRPSFTKAWLKKFPNDRLLSSVLELRRLEKNSGTFIQGLLGHVIDGRIHCQFNQLPSDDYGAVSGRFSSSNPNLQNIPIRDPEMGPLLRSMFIPDEGELWGATDYSQIEYRLLVEYAHTVYQGKFGSKEMMDRFLIDPSTDIHLAVAELCGIARSDGKAINFGMVYGLGIDALIASLGYTREVCQEIIDKYHGMMPFAKKLYKEAQTRAEKKGYITTLGKRKRRFNTWEPVIPWERNTKPTDPILLEFMKEAEDGKWVRDPDKRPKAYKFDKAREIYGLEINLKRGHCHTGLNGLLQGSAADIIKRAMVDIWKSGACDVLGAPLIQVHDELDWSIPDTLEGRQAFDHTKTIMEQVYRDRLKIPLKVDSKIGADWSECK